MNTKDILDDYIKNDFRAEQMETVLRNRLMFCREDLKRAVEHADVAACRARIQAYEDCLGILNKEFNILEAPIDTGIENYIKTYRDAIVNKLVPLDDSIKGTRLYREEMRKSMAVARYIEHMCYDMFRYGFQAKD